MDYKGQFPDPEQSKKNKSSMCCKGLRSLLCCFQSCKKSSKDSEENNADDIAYHSDTSSVDEFSDEDLGSDAEV